MRHFVGATVASLILCAPAAAQPAPPAATPAQQAPAPARAAAAPRDEFYWIGQINKASIVINGEQGLLDPALAPGIARALDAVLQAGSRPGGKRPTTVIAFEPLLIEAGGYEVTLIHAGRSSQDMLSTVRAGMMRDGLLRLGGQLGSLTQTMIALAERHAGTVVPNYTNGVAAQPNSYGHYLLGHVAGLERDAERLRQALARLDRSPMGTTVLNGTSWPLDRARMAAYLGFPTTVDNAYDAAQIAAAEMPVEIGALATALALHAGAYIEDVMTQYAQPRPWMLLAEGDGNTYVSSAMPQKRNPGLLNATRSQASQVIGLAFARVIQGHNIPPGMTDPKNVRENLALIEATGAVLAGWERILKAMVISPGRALEELDLDWTASQELADLLMRAHKLPFRVGHHFASEIVDHAKAHDIRPSAFPYAEAQRIYREALKHAVIPEHDLPLSEAAFRAALDPVAIIRDRATPGGPQPAEMARMLREAKERAAAHEAWIRAGRARIEEATAGLDRDFAAVLAKAR